MLLSDHQIKEQRLIADFIEKNFRATSYDLSVGKILTVDGTEVEDLKLQPSGVVLAISREKVTLPKDITGLAMVKTDLCNKGILALNIGIVGPGYDGHLSSILLNFSKNEFVLTKDEVFLRLVFHECYVSPREKFSDLISHDDYVKNRKKEVITFSSKFLNLEAIVKEVSNPILGDFRDQALKFVAVLVITLSLLTFLLTMGVNYSNRYVWSNDDIKRENIKADILKQVAASRETALESRIQELERQIQRVTAIQNQSEVGSSQRDNKRP